MLVFAFLARTLTSDVFGDWLFFLLVYGLYDMFRSGFIQTYFVKHFKHENERVDLNSSAFLLQLILSGIALLVVGVVSILPIEVNSAWLIGWAIIPIVSIPMSMAHIRYAARADFIGMGYSRVLFQLIMLIAVALVMPVDVYSVILIYIGSNLAIALWEGFRRKLGVISFSSHTHLKPMWRFGRYTSTTLAASNVLRSSDGYILMAFLGGTAVAIYGVAERLVGTAYIGVNALMGAVLPKLSSAYEVEHPEKLMKLAEREMGLLVWLTLPVALVLIFAAPQLVWLIAGDGYESSVWLLRIFGGYILLVPIDRTAGVILELTNSPQKNLQKVGLMLTFNIVLDILVLALGYDWNAVGLVTFGTLFVGILYGMWQVNRISNFSVFRSLRVGLNAILAFKNKHEQS